MKNTFALSAKFKFSILRLCHQIYVISGLAKKKTHFKKHGVAFCLPIFQQYIGMILLPSNYASDRVMQILRKNMNVTVTSNAGNCDFKFYFHCVNQVAEHGTRQNLGI